MVNMSQPKQFRILHQECFGVVEVVIQGKRGAKWERQSSTEDLDTALNIVNSRLSSPDSIRVIQQSWNPETKRFNKVCEGGYVLIGQSNAAYQQCLSGSVSGN